MSNPSDFTTADLMLVCAKRFIEEMDKMNATNALFSTKIISREDGREYDVRFEVSSHKCK